VRAVRGCDSLITNLTVEISTVSTKNITATLCAGSSYSLPSGTVVSTAGVYRDTIRYSGGCDSLITTANISVRNALRVTRTNAICEGDNYMLPWGRVVTRAGIYNDTMKSTLGCDSLITTVNLITTPQPTVAIIKSNDVNCMLGTATLTATGGRRYEWWSNSNAPISNPAAAKLVVSPTTTTKYRVRVTSAGGCRAEDSIEVKVDYGNPDGGYLLASAFTPNSDGKNDCFGVKSWGAITDLKFAIYNRWGEIVFQTTDPSACWGGTYKGVPQGTAAFVYQIIAKTICGGPVYRKGTIVLIR